eukprot:141171-Pleurochrysis_carterae.AAC.1
MFSHSAVLAPRSGGGAPSGRGAAQVHADCRISIYARAHRRVFGHGCPRALRGCAQRAYHARGDAHAGSHARAQAHAPSANAPHARAPHARAQTDAYLSS